MKNNIVANKEKVIDEIYTIYKQGNYRNMLWYYVPRDFWVEPFKKLFPNMYIYHDTDFNYSACFTMHINISPINGDMLSKEFDNYIEANGSVYSLLTDISTLAPYAIVKYIQYRIIKGEQIPFDSYSPFKKEHAKFGNKVKTFLQEKRISLLEDDILFAKVNEGISLENRTDDVRVFNCLFDDSDVWPR